MRRNIFYRKIPAALAAFVLALALCCQTAAAGRALVPGGYTVGIKLYAEGLMVTEVESGTPAQQAGIRKGDVIIAADGKKTDSAQALLGSIQKSEPIVVRVERGGREAEFLVTPEKTPSGYRLGVLVRDHIAGIGTVTYYDPETGSYGAPVSYTHLDVYKRQALRRRTIWPTPSSRPVCSPRHSCLSCRCRTICVWAGKRV